MALEINLVPDIKDEMIRTLKLRNFILFVCIIVASASVAVTLIFGMIVGGQQLAINGKVELLDSLSNKLNSYSDLNEFLTIKDQVGNISSIVSNKKLASRTFNILSALIPVGADTVQISELKINLTEEAPTFTFDAQANAGREPFIDYNVLDSFKKSMAYMRYDYGNYVDRDNNAIPAYCMLEKDASGAHFSDREKGLFAYWTIFEEGCYDFDEKDLKKITPVKTEDIFENADPELPVENNLIAKLDKIAGYDLENYEGQKVVKIWRTPQLDWYNEDAKPNAPQLSADGIISNVAHFDSKCIKYNPIVKDKKATKIDESTNICVLVLGETDEDRIQILESSNGRDSTEELVLRFSALISIAPEAFNFNNHHMIAIAPSERRNVTDSYVQLQSIFAKRAEDCQEGDTACKGGN